MDDQHEKLALLPGKKAYFASDIHLGLYPYDVSAKRERLFIQWLKEIQPSAGVLFLVGDIFDFWYEYRKVIPRGHTRLIGQLCEMADIGILIYMFTGNHDVWMFDYFQTEVGARVCANPIEIGINNKLFFIGHGDGVGPGDFSYKMLKRIFTSSICQFLFSRIHPNFALKLGQTWSKHSRYSKGIADSFHGLDNEYNILFAKEMLKQKPVDYFVFGHRHIPMDIHLGNNSKLFNLGEWIYCMTYGTFDGSDFALYSYRKDDEWKKNLVQF
jgi:UDP-2,3-diacylglucosamine hydrolase